MRRRRRGLLVGLSLIAVSLLAFLVAHAWVLERVGSTLVRSESPTASDIAIVLAGDASGARILKGCELVRAGLVPEVWVSGPAELTWYGANEAESAIRFAASKGCDARFFKPVVIDVLSTSEEAAAYRTLLQQQSLRRVLLVTSASHTARAGREFEKALKGVANLRVVASRERYFTPATWWHTREGQKTVFFELSKTAASYLGI